MARTSSLEEELSALTRAFVSNIVSTIRNASFGDVASFSWKEGEAPRRAPPKRGAPAAPKVDGPAPAPGRRPRQSAEKREQLGERIVDALSRASAPMGVRALSGALGVAPDLLAAPLKELRAASRIAKHGEKRNTTYSAA